jgi:hypothetical protein
MKIKGIRPGPNVETIVLPRGDGNSIVFKAQAVIDYAAFEKHCPPITVPRSQRPGGDWFENPEDPEYKAKADERSGREIDWMIIESLKATEGLTWEEVNPDRPDTWKFWKEELKKAGFSKIEINRIFNGVWAANSLDERLVKQARETFFRSQQAAQVR